MQLAVSVDSRVIKRIVFTDGGHNFQHTPEFRMRNRIGTDVDLFLEFLPG